jgi:hypothetical protein
MIRLARRPLARQATGVLLALLAVALFAPSAARASCGDYVLVGGHSAASPEHGAQVPDAPALPAGGHVPCSGPLCSRHVPPLPLLPLVPAPERGDQWGCVDPASLVPEDEALDRVADDALGRPVRHALAVYHPPR